jgi:membrane protease YdiL (CAAX protease family)
MVTLFDLLYVALFALILPAYDYLFGWRSYDLRVRESPARARAWLWRWSLVSAWGLVTIGAAYWLYMERPWSGLKLTMPGGWRLTVALAIVVAYTAYYARGIAQLQADARLREQVRASMGGAAGVVPHTRAEVPWFMAIAVTAGFCEEFLFRGYLIWTLSPWLGWWGAAAVSTLIFTIGHAYQGWQGVLRVGVMAVIYVLLIALLDSLWPTIVLHILVDALNGFAAWVVLRDYPVPVATDQRDPP